MYSIDQSRETRPEVLIQAMAGIGLATLFTAEGGLAATLPPVTVRESGGRLTLAGHFARANPHWRAIGSGTDALAIFLGPHAYVSPDWYETKKETGKSVPTWAYVAVEARGILRLIEDPQDLQDMLEDLTRFHESGRVAPWRVDDAPAGYLAAMMRAIVGFELEVSGLSGVWKLNQAKSPGDRAGTALGLAGEGKPGASELSALILEGLADGQQTP